MYSQMHPFTQRMKCSSRPDQHIAPNLSIPIPPIDFRVSASHLIGILAPRAQTDLVLSAMNCANQAPDLCDARSRAVLGLRRTDRQFRR
jgi:hypothetical protein